MGTQLLFIQSIACIEIEIVKWKFQMDQMVWGLYAQSVLYCVGDIEHTSNTHIFLIFHTLFLTGSEDKVFKP